MSGRKPDLNVSIKPVGEGQRITLGAWWREDGKLRGGWDKRVKRVYVLLDDGRGGELRVDVKQENGKRTHYLNVWEERGEAASPKRSAPDAPPPDPFGDDDIPF